MTEGFLRAPAGWLALDLRWLTFASFRWTYAAVGRDWFWFKLGNLLLHTATAAMLFLFLRRLFDAVLPQPRQGLEPGWLAFFGALLFLLHPAAVYAVAYVMQRSTVMATLFGLVALYLLLEGLLRRSALLYAASAAAYFFALFSKEHCLMLPAVAAAIALLVRGRSPSLARELALPFALYGALGALIVLRLKGLLGAPYEPHAEAAMRQVAAAEHGALAAVAPALGWPGPYPLSVINQGALFFRYLGTWLLPVPAWMSVDLRAGFPAQLLSWQAAGFAAWLAWPAVGLWLLLKGGKKGLAGLAMLAPWLLALTEVATVRVQEVFVLYRSYLWMALLPAALPALLARLNAQWSLTLLFTASLVLLAPLGNRLGTFSTDVALWDDAVRKLARPDAPFADRTWRGRGIAYYHEERYEEALADFEQALRLDPKNAEAWVARGTLFMRTAQSARALSDFDRALALNSGHAEALGRRCVVLMRLARLEDALADCQQAVRLAPLDPDNHTALGMVYALSTKAAQAEAAYGEALSLAPSDAPAHYQFGILLRGTGRAAEARGHFEAACRAGLARACDAAR